MRRWFSRCCCIVPLVVEALVERASGLRAETQAHMSEIHESTARGEGQSASTFHALTTRG